MFCQGLPSQPPHEFAQMTVMNWAESLWPGRTWNEKRDEPRMREAFRRMRLNCKMWPQPSDFVTSLPQIEPIKDQLPRPSNDNVRLREMSKIADIINLSDYTKAS